MLKFIYSEKATKILRNLPLTFDHSTYSQKLVEDFAKFCGLLRIYELYLSRTKNEQMKIKTNLKNLLDVSDEAKEKALIAQGTHDEILNQAEIQMKYDGYIEREQDQAEKMSRLENVKIPLDLDFKKLNSLSTEAKEKLSEIKPVTIGQASRVSGVSPSDVSVLLVYMGR